MLGVSTRRVEDLVEALGIAGLSKSEVSRICTALDAEVETFARARSARRGTLIEALMQLEVSTPIVLRSAALSSRHPEGGHYR